jgi:hypothetical protein
VDFGVAIGIGGIVVGVVATLAVYLWSKRERKMVYTVTTANLVRPSVAGIAGLTVAFFGESVATVSVSRVTIWNKGREAVRKEDITASAPLRIVMRNGAAILHGEVLTMSRPSNQFRLLGRHSPASDVEITLDYLGRNQGAVVQVVHTGVDSSDIEVTGDLTDGGGIARIPPRVASFGHDPLRALRSAPFLTFMLVALAAGLVPVVAARSYAPWPFFLLGSFTIGQVAGSLMFDWKMPGRVPKVLRVAD